MATDESDQGFARFTLDGERFDGARLPVEALVELQRYRALIVAAARLAYEEDHPNELLPEDFDSTFDLAITGVEDGSAVAVLDRSVTEYDLYFESGRDNLDAALSTAVTGPLEFAEEVATWRVSGRELEEPTAGEDRPTAKVLETLAAIVDLDSFRNFGSSLRPNESIMIAEDAQSEPTEVITFSSRSSNLMPFIHRVDQFRPRVNAADQPRRQRRQSTVAGRLIAINAEKTNFELQTLQYGQIHGRYKNRALTADLKAVLDSSSRAPVVRVTGRMTWLGEDLQRILDVSNIELFEVEGDPWSGRLVELASLPKDWSPDEDTSDMISFTGLDAAREILRATAAEARVRPGLYPREDGGVEVEWATPSRVISVEVSPDAEFLVHDFVVTTKVGTEVRTDILAEAIEAIVRALS